MRETELVGPTSHIFVSQRLRLHYVDWGNRDAPLLILQHGGRDHSRSWDWVARALRHDWHVVAPDLRGHGDSEWSKDGTYTFAAYLYDFAQLLHQLNDRPAVIVSHSLGAAITLRYAGLFPENVSKLVAIEGSGTMPPIFAKRAARPFVEKWRDWIDERRLVSARQSRRYEKLDDAVARMREENAGLSEEQIVHLTVHAVTRNEDGSYSWKFDPYVRHAAPIDISTEDREALWNRIDCPVLLPWGRRSWNGDPDTDGTTALFRNARAAAFDAGHWLHHDRFDVFMKTLQQFCKTEQH
jgi:pimeloyl-ACP methyl ester carboxylesterase